MLLYLLFTIYLTPMALNKSRLIISQSQFNSFLPTIRSQQFSDSFKGLTFFVEEKVDNEIKNIFLYDNGNNLQNLSSSKSNFNSTTIIAEKGVVERKNLFLINGEIISSKKSEKVEVVKFEQLNISLEDLATTVIKKPKLQETSTSELISCFMSENTLEICNSETKKEIIPILIRRLALPMYIPVICLICSFLLLKNQNIFFKKLLILKI